MITKLRTAKKRSHKCGKCNKEIPIGSQYYDTDERDEIKIFSTIKYCKNCGRIEMKKDGIIGQYNLSSKGFTRTL